MLYILIYNEETIHSPWGKWVTVYEKKARLEHLLHEALTETTTA